MRSRRLTVQERRTIFEDLVKTQDSVPRQIRKSYELVTEKFEITDSQLRQIETEGIEKQWPPLDEVAAV